MNGKEKREEEVREMAQKMSDFVNSITFNMDIPLFVNVMSREHRTLQQSFSALCFAWIQHLASLNENEYDLRNEAAVKAAKKLIKHCDKYDLEMPLI